jgi:hypothetical protein
MVEKNEILLKVYKSRKAYILYYFFSLIIIFSLIYLYFRGYVIESYVFWICFIFVLGIIYTTEIIHHREWWAVTNNSLIHSVSIVNKNVREVDFSSISDLDLDKPLYQRILNYGDVNVRLFLNETSIKIRHINSPEKFIKFLRGLILKNRSQKNVVTRNG